ncbi:MAG TPA: hypothetical protein VGT98_09545, partial [Candidatus Elarobacter sp.]|nr:hypothetical protein [Candidatus Elarobacter sp.]
MAGGVPIPGRGYIRALRCPSFRRIRAPAPHVIIIRIIMTTTHKLWGGRFAAPPAHALDALNRSIG